MEFVARRVRENSRRLVATASLGFLLPRTISSLVDLVFAVDRTTSSASTGKISLTLRLTRSHYDPWLASASQSWEICNGSSLNVDKRASKHGRASTWDGVSPATCTQLPSTPLNRFSACSTADERAVCLGVHKYGHTFAVGRNVGLLMAVSVQFISYSHLLGG
jgi:hypothetical protein